MKNPLHPNLRPVILAAGASRRLGQPKQLLSFQGKTLLARVIESCRNAHLPHPLVLTGYRGKTIQQSQGNNIGLWWVQNLLWQQGLSSSINKAIAILKETQTQFSLFLLCDQPFLNHYHLEKMLVKARVGNFPIIASRYENNDFGPPLIIHRDFWPKFCHLTGDSGGKAVLKQNLSQVSMVDFPLGCHDIDTPADVQFFLSHQKELGEKSMHL